MLIIDADTHYIEPDDWLQQVDPQLSAQMPYQQVLGAVISGLFSDVLESIPERYRPDPTAILPPSIKQFLQSMSALPSAKARELIALNQGEVAKPNFRPEQRLKDMEEQGVDIQLVFPNHAAQILFYVRRAMPELINRTYAAYNTWTMQTLAGHTDRLIPAAMIALEDLDWAIAELARVRKGGCRSFLFDVAPVNGVSLSDQPFERFWAACADLGMLPTLHVGFSRPRFPGEYANSQNLNDLAPILFNQTPQIPEVFFTSMIFKGVFARHPRLRILVAEYGTYWLAHFLVKLVLQPEMDAFQMMVSRWQYPLKPIEYAHQHIKVSPMRHDRATFPLLLQSQLPGLEQDLAQALSYIDNMLVFSSDYPHKEGTATAVQFWQESLQTMIPALSDSFIQGFFGGTLEECLA